MPNRSPAPTDSARALHLAAASILLLAAVAGAQINPALVADLNPALLPSGPAAAAPSGLTAVNGRLFFAAAGPTGGVEPFFAAASPLAASPLPELRPGTRGCLPHGFLPLGDAVAFLASDGVTPAEQVWLATGSPPQSAPLALPSGVSFPSDLTPIGSVLCFAAQDAVAGRELWSFDPSTGLVARLADLRPGTTGSFPFSLTPSGGRLFFIADDGSSGRELWSTTGPGVAPAVVGPLAPAGLSAVGSPLPAQWGDRAGVLTVVTIYSGTTLTDQQLWFTDGTPDGTSLLLSTGSGPLAESIINPVPLDSGLALFLTRRDTSTGPALLRLVHLPGPGIPRVDVATLGDGSSLAFLGPPARLGNRLFFAFEPALGGGVHLWTSDLSPGGTHPVPWAGIGPAPRDPSELLPTPVGVYFPAHSDATGVELFRADPCARAITLVGDLLPGPASSSPQELTLLGRTLFLTARDPATSQELWALDLPFNPDCPADFNADGTLDPADLADAIAAHFDPAADADGRADFNRDCRTDPDDLADFIAAYFAGC